MGGGLGKQIVQASSIRLGRKNKTPLQEVGLKFILLGKPKIIMVSVRSEWAEVEKVLADEFGREVYFSWFDEDEVVIVDTEEEWEDLIAELAEDWLEENEFNGTMQVELVEADKADKKVTGHRRNTEGDGGRIHACDLYEITDEAAQKKPEDAVNSESLPPEKADGENPFDHLAVLRGGVLELSSNSIELDVETECRPSQMSESPRATGDSTGSGHS